MPLTLYRYILRDLLKLLLLATGALVVLLSIGSTLKPISEGLLGPWQLIKVIGYTMPVMLVIALPFAAAFAVTLVFFRLSQDNEIAACSASGISYRSLCLPMVVLGAVLTLTMFYLSNWIVPYYLEQATQLVERDFTRMFIRKIQRRETIRWGDMVIYADNASERRIDPAAYPNSIRPYRSIALQGAAVGKLSKHTGNLSAHYTGQTAVIDLYRYNNRLYATVMLSNATFKHPRSGTLVSVKRQAFGAQELPLPLQYDPKFMSLPNLQRTAREPDLHPDVMEYRRDLLKAMITARTLRHLEQQLRNGEAGGLLRLEDQREQQGMSYHVRAPICQVRENRLQLQASQDHPVLVRVGRGLSIQQRLEAQRGRVDITVNPQGDEPRIDITLEDVRVIDQALPTPESRVGQVYLTLLRYDRKIADPLNDLKSLELRDRAAESTDAAVTARAKALVRRINDLRREIISRVHERGATATSCMMVMLLAGLLAMLLRRQGPLMIFFWCFLPAIVNMVIINSGQNLIDSGTFNLLGGMAVTWSGIVLMGVMGALVYRRLSRN